MNSPTEMLAPAEFSRRLREESARYRCEDTRLYQLLMRRRCPRPLLQQYAASTLMSARLSVIFVADLALSAPNERAQLLLLKNLMEEEGMQLRGGVGIVARSEARHPDLALRFARACGLSEESPLRGGRESRTGRDYVAQGRWLEAVSYLLVGQEFNFSNYSQLVMQALIKQGMAPRDLAFFAIHGPADQKHGEEALSMVVENAHTREDQDAALRATAEGALQLFEAYGGAARTAAAG